MSGNNEESDPSASAVDLSLVQREEDGVGVGGRPVEQSSFGLTAKFQPSPINTGLENVRPHPQTFELQEVCKNQPYSRDFEASYDLVELLDESQEELYCYGRGITASLTLSCSAKVLSECMEYFVKNTLLCDEFTREEKVGILSEALEEWPIYAIRKVHTHVRSAMVRAMKTARIYYPFYEEVRATTELRTKFDYTNESNAIVQLTYALCKIRTLDEEIADRKARGEQISELLLDAYNTETQNK
jgi:hypothetical protein